MSEFKEYHEENREDLLKLERDLKSTIKELRYKNEELKNYIDELLKIKKMIDESQKLAHLGTWEMDLETNKIKCSDEIYRICGYDVPSDDTEPEFKIEIIHPDDRDISLHKLNECIKNNTPYTIEERIIKPNGEIRWIESRGIIYHDNDGNRKLLGSYMDITDRKKYEEEIKEAKSKAEESDKLKTLFLANMSHEIRTPLNSIIGFSKLLLKNGFNKNEIKKYLITINKNGEQLLKLINDIIDISKIEVNEIKLEKTMFFINDLMEELYDIFISDINLNRKKLKLIYKKSNKKLNPYIEADKMRLKQILDNLLSNAIKFTEKGKIEFGYEFINDPPIHMGNNPNIIKFYVRDTGIGIDKSKQKEIFDRFIQLNRKEHSKRSGTGLGLSISKGLVKLMDGEIDVISEINKGSEFYFSIPFSKIDYGIIEKEDYINNNYNEISFKGIKILVAEDVDDNYELIKEMLIPTKCEIIRAKNGVEALNLLEKNKFDIILLDMRMPIKSGYDVIYKIRKTDKILPVIAQTAYALSNDKDNLIKLGFTDYISKPIDRELLIKTISKYI